MFANLRRVRQDDFLARPGRWRTLALLHGHQVADVGQDSLQVRHPGQDILGLILRDLKNPDLGIRKKQQMG